MRRLSLQLGIGRDRVGRFDHGFAVGAHVAGLDRGLGPGATLEQAALD
jgi:hypothetical protein